MSRLFHEGEPSNRLAQDKTDWNNVRIKLDRANSTIRISHRSIRQWIRDNNLAIFFIDDYWLVGRKPIHKTYYCRTSVKS